MSWKEYIDRLVSEGAKEAVIADLQGNIYAQTPSLKINADDVKKMADGIADGGVNFREKGILFNGNKYVFTSADVGNCVRGKKGTGGLHASKTAKLVVVALYEEPTVPQQCATSVFNVCDYLLKSDY